VADGMGGHNAGEVASKSAIESVVAFVRSTHDPKTRQNLTWPFSYDPSLSMTANRLIAAVRLSNRKVFDDGTRDPNLNGMGTTLVAALVSATSITIANVGDSRAYRLRKNELAQMTRDDTWLTAMLGADAAAADASDHPMRHVLTSGIGMRSDVSPAIVEHPIGPGDRWLLCTDGVHGYLSDEVISQTLDRASSAEEAADLMIGLAIERGTTDNVTAVVLFTG
jgi:serine/threonine protein phosphatase PrpC